MINDFTTDDSNCDILQYKASYDSPAISQPECSSSDEKSEFCKSLVINTAIIGTSLVTFLVTADGGSSSLSNITFETLGLVEPLSFS